MKKFLSLILLFLSISGVFAQVKDSTRYQLNLKNLAIPTSIMIIGFTQLGHESKELQLDLQEDFPFFKSRLDDLAQYLPLSAVLISGSLGLKTAHDFKSRLIYSAISYATMGLTVNILKKTITETRPDNSGNNSFPSGHTAFSFTGAEIFHQELKESHPVLSYAAFPLAAGVGIYRMLNNKHYLSDVLVGAGLGILSAKFAYAIYHPKISNKEDKLSLNFAPTNVLGKNGLMVTARF
jgi:hypothetical protein